MLELSKVKEFFDNKDIALIGNSGKLLEQSYGSQIDSHECVIRINLFFGKGSNKVESLGKKVDAWASGASEEWRKKYFRIYKSIPILVLCPFHRYFEAPDNCYKGGRGDYLRLKQRVGCKPSTGCMVINFILKYINYKKLSLYGIDGFKNLPWTWKTNHPDEDFYCPHNKDNKEIKYLEKLVNSKDNIIWYR
jgi:hypothetical protein